MAEYPVEQRAGGIVFRKNNGQIEYLLVTSNSNKERWIFPAGHVEAGETDEEAALREVAEEAGVQAKTICDFGAFQHYWIRNNQKITLNTHLFIMEYLQTLVNNPEGRQVRFFPYEAILKLQLWEESKVIIQKADRYCRGL